VDPTVAPPEWRVSHYRVLGSLGKGGMGEVYAALDETLKRRVALKSIRADHRLNAESKARFLREARLLSQLDHPNVCRVYDYVEDNATDWLVLELVEGRNLRDLIAQGIDDKKKLTIAEQIAGVLVVTHAAGVVHRDLKPANVMLTTSGEVKVLDFGLAQPLRTTAAESNDGTASEFLLPLTATSLDTTHLSAGRAASTLASAALDDESLFRTAVGSVSGTVAYMSPEQAMGRPATAASDMYSFGLLLQELFTGRPPYHANLGPAQLLERVRRADTPAPAGVSSDMAALIARLKSPAPTQRPTAVDVLDRLRWIHNKPARRLRQLVAAGVVVALVAGAAKYTFDLERERTAAVAARADADQRRKQAETLIGFMIGNLRPKLQQVGRLDLLDDVGKEATAYFKAVPIEALSNEEIYRQSQSVYQIGQVYQQRGNLALAVEAYRDSLALITAVATRVPENTDWQLGLGTAHFYLGDALRRQGNLDGALEHFRSYWQIAERLLARAPKNPTWKLEVSFGHSNVASILELKGDLHGGRAELETTLQLQQELVVSDPSNADWQRRLANSHNRLGIVLQKLGDFAGAENHQRQHLAILLALLAKSPNDAPLLHRVAVAYAWQAAALSDLGRDEDANRHHEASFAVTSALVARDSSNADWQFEHANVRLRLAEAEFLAGNQASAETKYREAIAVLSGQLQKNPTLIILRRYLGNGYARRARVLRTAGRTSAALREAETCAGLFDAIRASGAGDSGTGTREGRTHRSRVRRPSLSAVVGPRASRRGP
jgi:tRNA A-37 threonylcarbamoyl transferase component Bud32/tetratricopeptide (TPR) repeat protein